MELRRCKRYLAAGPLLILGIILFTSAPARAQAELFGLNASGEVEAGVRFIEGDHSSSKFEEYREINRGLFLEDLSLDLEDKKDRYYIQFRGHDFIEEDQNYQARAGRYGKYYFEFEWDQIPHVFSNTGQLLHNRAGKGTFVLADIIQSTIQGGGATVEDFASQVHPIDLELRRDKAKFEAKYTPIPEWDFRFGYSNERMEGTRPFATTFGFTNIVELPEPIEYRTHTITASAEYARKDWLLKFAYLGSLFDNETTTLVWDNPLRIDDAVGASSRGRLALYPDNQAHNLELSGAVNLAGNTRLTGTVARGWRFQDEDFLPFTINSALAPFDSLASLPTDSLDGEVKTWLLNLVVTNRFFKDWTFTGRYRLYDFDNDTPSIIFDQYIRTDQSVRQARRNLPYEYTKQNAGVDVAWHISRALNLKLGWAWEGWDRKFRETDNTDEHTVGTKLGYNAAQGLFLRALYQHSWRTYDDYDSVANAPSFPEDDPPAPNLELRKFTQSTRERNRAELLVQLVPIDPLTLAFTYSLLDDAYRKSELFGLTKVRTHSYSFDVTYQLGKRVSLFVDFTREDINTKVKSWIRPFVDPADIWASRTRDLVHTFGAGVDVVLIPDKLNMNTFFSQSYEKGRERLEGNPGGNPLGNIADYPDITHRLTQIGLNLNYHIRKNITAKLKYLYERYSETDFLIDVMKPWMGDVDSSTASSLFLGARVPNYEAHIVGFLLNYKF